VENIADLVVEVPGIRSVEFTALDIASGDFKRPGIAVVTGDGRPPIRVRLKQLHRVARA